MRRSGAGRNAAFMRQTGHPKKFVMRPRHGTHLASTTGTPDLSGSTPCRINPAFLSGKHPAVVAVSRCGPRHASVEFEPCPAAGNGVSTPFTMTAFSIFRVAACGVLLAAAGCGKQTSSRLGQGHALPQPPLISKSEPGERGGRFVIAITGSLQTFNPLFAFDGASDAVTRMLFSSLVSLDLVTHEPGPGLAESWSVEPDQKTWTFKLRQGLRWSDGTPLTAADVAFTWNDIMYNPEYNRFTYELFRIRGQNFTVTNPDDFTVRVVTPEIFAPFVEFFG